MSTTTDSKFHARHVALRILSSRGGVSTTAGLGQCICDGFGIEPGDTAEFVKVLVFIKKMTPTADEAMEAAFNALNIGGEYVDISLSDRQVMLLTKRSDESLFRSDLNTLESLEREERDGFNIIAATYDMAVQMMAHEQFVENIRAMADNNSNAANMRRPLNIELTKLAVALG